MKMIVVSILLAGAMGVAGAAHAQGNQGNTEPSFDNPFSGPIADTWRPMGPSPDDRTIPWSGIRAMKANDFVGAEAMFADFLARKPESAEANLYMGVVKMNLGKWSEAKPYLESAAAKEPTHPDPKIRLGLTYVKLGDTTAAIAQRAALVKMRESAKGSREMATHISDGVAMIDRALAGTSRG